MSTNAEINTVSSDPNRFKILMPWLQLESLEAFFIHGPPPNGDVDHMKQAQKYVIEPIVGDHSLVIALVFSTDHKNVRAVPIPEFFDKDEHRKVIEHTQVKVEGNLSAVDFEVSQTLDWQQTHQVKRVLNDVILLEKNLGTDRHNKPLIVATLDETNLKWINEEYLNRIKEVQKELNNTDTSGKSVKSAV